MIKSLKFIFIKNKKMNKELNITDEEYKEITKEPKNPIKLDKKNLGNVSHNIY